MNKSILSGRLTSDPNVTYSQNGDNNLCIARFTLAVDRKFKKEGDEQTADFIRCVAFGKTGEFVEKWYKQGIKIIVEGRIQTGSYKHKDGHTVYTTDIIVENTEFCESKKNSQANGQTEQTAQPKQETLDNAGFSPAAGQLPF